MRVKQVASLVYQRTYFSVRAIGQMTCHTVASRVPAKWVPRSDQLAGQLTIGITTYEGRYDQYFKHLIQALSEVFDDINIVVAVNGSKNGVRQQEYIERLVGDYGDKAGIHFMVHSDVVGLAQLWNEIVQYCNTPHLLLLNDDIEIDPWFRVCLQRIVGSNQGITTINGSWSHFLMSRDLYDNVGGFDEEFVGIGFEDIDYYIRMHRKGLRVNNVICREIYDLTDDPDVTSFDHMGGRTWGKYTKGNEEHFRKKYKVLECEGATVPEQAVFVKQLGKYVVPQANATGKVGRMYGPVSRKSCSDGHGRRFVPMDGDAKRIMDEVGGGCCER